MTDERVLANNKATLRPDGGSAVNFDQRRQQVDVQYNVAGNYYQYIEVSINLIQQAGLQAPQTRNLQGLLDALQQALPHLSPVDKDATGKAIVELRQAIAELPAQERTYLERVKAGYQRQSNIYVDLTTIITEKPASETLELVEIAELMGQVDDLAELRTLHQVGQEVKQVDLPSLREGLDRYDTIILLGDPGSGKTTSLEYLAFELASQPLNSGDLVLFLPLSLFDTEIPLESDGQAAMLNFIADNWGAPPLVANLEGYLEAGRLVVLFDALNEMSRRGYEERVRALRRFIDTWHTKGNRFLVSCRVLDYQGGLTGLQRVIVQPFSDVQIQTFLKKVLKKQWQGMWIALLDTGDEARRLLEMARNPYVLRMMVLVYVQKGGVIPSNRAQLMQYFTQTLLKWSRSKTPAEEWLDEAVQTEAISIMAYEMQVRDGSGAAVKTSFVKAAMPEVVQPDLNWPPVSAPPNRVLELAASAALIKMPVGQSTIRFYHQLLQEYFAAHQLSKRNPADLTEYWRWPWLETEMQAEYPWTRPEDNYDPLPPPNTTGWEETTILAAGMAPKNDDQLVRTLIRINPVLAGRCLHEGRARVDKAVRQGVIEALLETIARPEVALRVRISAGEVLGYLGDPRLGEMVEVPEGEFWMGNGKNQANEKPRHSLFLPTYRLGKYPVTNAEYQHFIEAGGYREQRWWTDVGWTKKETGSWDHPRYWHDSRFNKPNQPVVGVSWYEAVAYCRWLSTKRRAKYRLPTEAEWEKGSRGADGRVYPWGDGWDSSHLNAGEGRQIVRVTTPVGIYPSGASPCGALDCAGNVWEWCATIGGDSYPYDTTKDEWTKSYIAGNERRVLRGGSWLTDQSRAQCTFRNTYNPSFNFLKDNGLRVVCLEKT